MHDAQKLAFEGDEPVKVALLNWSGFAGINAPSIRYMEIRLSNFLQAIESSTASEMYFTFKMLMVHGVLICFKS